MDKKDQKSQRGRQEIGAEEKEENRKGTRGHGKKGGRKVWKKGRKKIITN